MWRAISRTWPVQSPWQRKCPSKREQIHLAARHPKQTRLRVEEIVTTRRSTGAVMCCCKDVDVLVYNENHRARDCPNKTLVNAVQTE